MNTKTTQRRIWSRNDNATSKSQIFSINLVVLSVLLVLIAGPILLQIVTPQALASVQTVTIPYGAFDPNFNTAAPRGTCQL
jgi:hypothetical protein